jgi:hypothetical protein
MVSQTSATLHQPSTVVLAKIDDASATDYFITFNRQTGINSGKQEAGNLVTVTTTGNEGTSYAKSSLLAKLGAGGSWSGTIDGKTMKVIVLSITTSSSPAYATVRISENGNSCSISDPILPTTNDESPNIPSFFFPNDESPNERTTNENPPLISINKNPHQQSHHLTSNFCSPNLGTSDGPRYTFSNDRPSDFEADPKAQDI